MAQKKRSNNLQEQKQQKARKKKEFMNKLLMVCKVIGDESLYYLIPEDLRWKIYIKRGVVKVRGAKGVKIQKRLLEVLEKSIKQQLLVTNIELIAGSGRTISLADYYTVGMSLELGINKDHADEQFDGKERFSSFLAESDRRQYESEMRIKMLCEMVCNLYDDFSQKRIYSYTLGVETNLEKADFILKHRLIQNFTQQMMDDLDFKLYHTITIGAHPLEVKHVSFKGDKRPVIQLGMMHHPELYDESVFIPFKISGETLNINSTFAKLMIPVYIQQHALNRILERSGYVIPGLCKIDLIKAVLQPVITHIAKKRYLIEYRMMDVKIGYLVVELIDGMIVIITFLLMTNNGTPEGDKLAELTGLKKLDKEYLMIDNISSLASSDILESETVCNLFRDAGCQSILDACKRVKNDRGISWMVGMGEQKNSMSELIIEYLKPDANNDEYVTE
ncbi:MAG: hypothetical protein LBS80_04335 [Tannerella sp.]|jgi:hypothetical protein|nr:hypothetical protein [Tannerella sp.]